MKDALPLIVFFCCLLLAGYSRASGNPEEFIGPVPGMVHIYEEYAGGFTRVWGLDRTPDGELTTVVETIPPSVALGGDGDPHKRYLLRKYLVSGCRVVLKNETETHILLDLCHDEWEYQAPLHVGIGVNNNQSINDPGKKQEILCRIISRTILFFQEKEREVIHVSYSYITRKNERRILGSAFFVEGLGQLIGGMSEPLQCRQATEHELKMVRRLIDEN